MFVEKPLAHGEIIERLWQAARSSRLPHALILEGPRGIGKFLAAKWFSMGMLCETGPGEPCGSCGPCKRVLSGGVRGNHPDLFLIDPIEEEEERIRVTRIALRSDSGEANEECVESFLGLRAFEGRGRVVLVRESHRMNPAAQNALLKTLEEPRPGTLLVLETHRPELLLTTIRSRCVRLGMPSLSAQECAEVLSRHGVEGESAALLARWSSGSPGHAIELDARGVLQQRQLLEELLLGRRDPLQVSALVWDVEGDFPGKTPLAKARERARVFLDLALALAADLQRLEAGVAPESLSHGDLLARLPALPFHLAQRLEVLLGQRADVERNLNPEVIVDRACLALGDALPIIAG